MEKKDKTFFGVLIAICILIFGLLAIFGVITPEQSDQAKDEFTDFSSRIETVIDEDKRLNDGESGV